MAISMKNINYQIDDRKILENISLHVNQGDFITILGRNGCGKSTIIKAIAKEISVEGNIEFFNEDIDQIKPKVLAKKLAVLNQHSNVSEDITVVEYVAYGRIPFRGLFKSETKEDVQIIEKMLKLTGLMGMENRYLSTLSGGELKRVHLALCLVKQPKVLILDEPTNHLDVKYQFELLKLIRKINEEDGVTVICVLHDINQAIKFSDYLYLIKDGKIFANGASDDVITIENVKEVFDVDIMIHKLDIGTHIDYLI